MKKLGQLLGSATRTELLRVFMYQPAPVGLRFAAHLAGVHPHSAELALKRLVQEDIVCRQQHFGGPLYELNRKSADCNVLKAVFEAERCSRLKQRAAALQHRAAAILPFIEEANRMLSKATSRRVGLGR